MEIDSYQSPFSYRYGTVDMRRVWSEKNRRILWHRAWLEAAAIQFDVTKQGTQGASYYTREQYEEALEEEKVTKHDLVAERNMFCKRLPPDVANCIHVGITSSDIEDFADQIMIGMSVSLLGVQVRRLIRSLATFSDKTKGHVILGRTHLQRAEPTLLGYRFIWYLERIVESGLLNVEVRGKGMHGAVGTNANLELMGSSAKDDMFALKTPVFQTYPRQEDLVVCGVLAQLASVIHKMAFDIRIMAMEGIVSETKSHGQYGSSAMPGKNNPIQSEKLCGLSRLFPGYYNSLWQTAANSLLERTLDDSCLRRVVLPEMFLCMSELLDTADKLMNKIRVMHSDHESLQWVMGNWECWLPSRMLTLVLSEGLGVQYQEVYAKVESLLGTGMTAEQYVGAIYGQVSNVERFIGLSHLEEFIENRIKYWISFVTVNS